MRPAVWRFSRKAVQCVQCAVPVVIGRFLTGSTSHPSGVQTFSKATLAASLFPSSSCLPAAYFRTHPVRLQGIGCSHSASSPLVCSPHRPQLGAAAVRRACTTPAVPHPRMQLNTGMPFSGIGEVQGTTQGSTTQGSTTQSTTLQGSTVQGSIMQGTESAPTVDASSDVLASSPDHYGGIFVDESHLPLDPQVFSHKLQASLQAWRAAGVRGVWLKVPCPSHAALLAPAMQGASFVPHHAETGYVMLCAWLPEAEPNTLPPNASHQVGVGAIVVNERGEILVVQERNGPLKGKGVWKMPTGLVATGEDLTTAAEREVEEETGVRARFESVLAVRQSHGFAFGKSDLFVCCGLRAEPGQGAEVVPQESELEAAKWMSIAEYAAQPFLKGVPMFETLRERSIAYAEGRYKGMRAEKMEAGFLKQRQDLLIWGEGGEATNGTQ